MSKSNLGIVMCFVALVAVGVAHTVQAQKKTPTTKMAQTKRAMVKDAVSPRQKSSSKFDNPMDADTSSDLDVAAARAKERVDNARRLLDAGDIAGAKSECMTAFDVAPVFNGVPDASEAKRLLGEINYAQRNYTEALRWLGAYGQNTIDDQLDFDIALCYVRMGDYGNAKRHYSHELVYANSSSTTAADLPVISNLQSLEASILLARGLDHERTSRPEKASTDYDAAARLAPTNTWLSARRGWIALRAGRQEEGYALMRKAALSKNPSILSDVNRMFSDKELAELRAAKGIVDKPTTPAD